MTELRSARAATGRVFNTRNNLPPATRAQVSVLLNLRLSDAIDLDTQTRHAHWNVKGPHFSSLRLLFKEVYEAVEGYVDLLAERVVQLGGVAAGTARMTALHSTLTEYPQDMVGGTEHVNALAAALAQFGAHMRATNTEVIGLRDQDTADICTEISRGVDKHLWLVEAHTQSRTNGQRSAAANGRRIAEGAPRAPRNSLPALRGMTEVAP